MRARSENLEDSLGRSFRTLDVFTDKAFAGNPLAVVLDAEGLTKDEMQAIAREFGLSETVFVLPAEKPAHTAKVRIFTPATEVPFAGHPTVGTAVLLATEKFGALDQEEDAIIVLEEGVGPVRIGVKLRPGEAGFAEFDAVGLPEDDGAPAPDDRLAAALGLAPNEIGFENHKPTRFSSGLPFTFVPVHGLEAIGRATVVARHWPEAFGGDGYGMAFVYCRETVHNDAWLHARMFAPMMLAAPEDPATGSAAVALAGVIHRFDRPPDGLHAGVIEQGYEMGRPSAISLELEIDRGRLHRVRIGGQAIEVTRGELTA